MKLNEYTTYTVKGAGIYRMVRNWNEAEWLARRVNHETGEPVKVYGYTAENGATARYLYTVETRKHRT